MEFDFVAGWVMIAVLISSVIALILVKLSDAKMRERKLKSEETQFYSLGKQYSPRKVVKLKEPGTGKTEYHVVEASDISDYSESPSPSPEAPPEKKPARKIVYTAYYPYTTVTSSGIWNPMNSAEIEWGRLHKPSNDDCPFCGQKKYPDKNFCPHCGGHYGNSTGSAGLL